jgi:hypothetical protein
MCQVQIVQIGAINGDADYGARTCGRYARDLTNGGIYREVAKVEEGKEGEGKNEKLL